MSERILLYTSGLGVLFPVRNYLSLSLSPAFLSFSLFAVCVSVCSRVCVCTTWFWLEQHVSIAMFAFSFLLCSIYFSFSHLACVSSRTLILTFLHIHIAFTVQWLRRQQKKTHTKIKNIEKISKPDVIDSSFPFSSNTDVADFFHLLLSSRCVCIFSKCDDIVHSQFSHVTGTPFEWAEDNFNGWKWPRKMFLEKKNKIWTQSPIILIGDWPKSIEDLPFQPQALPMKSSNENTWEKEKA